ncbi:MAG: prepilin peptidase [Candidatus Diapherotrites archaeon]
MFPLASFLFSLLGLVIASYTDLRWRIVPNYIPYALGGMGIVLALYESFIASSIAPFLLSAGVMVGTYVIAYVFWRAGAWAGGDVKLFTGLAVLNPLNPFVLGSFFNFSFFFFGKEWVVLSSFPVFMLNLFIVSVFMLIPYTGFLSLQALSKKVLRKEWLSITWSAILSAVVYAFTLSLFSAVLQFYSLPLWGVIIPLLLVAFFPPLVRYGLAGFGLISILSHFSPVSSVLVILGAFLLLNVLRAWYGFAQRHVLTKTKKITELEDGDIPGEAIFLRDGKIVRETPWSFQTIIKAGLRRDATMLIRLISPSGEALANPRRAAGLYPDDILRLQKEVHAGHLADEIKVKASSPFVPAVLLAYVFLSLLGDGPLAGVFG